MKEMVVDLLLGAVITLPFAFSLGWLGHRVAAREVAPKALMTRQTEQFVASKPDGEAELAGATKVAGDGDV